MSESIQTPKMGSKHPTSMLISPVSLRPSRLRASLGESPNERGKKRERIDLHLSTRSDDSNAHVHLDETPCVMCVRLLKARLAGGRSMRALLVSVMAWRGHGVDRSGEPRCPGHESGGTSMIHPSLARPGRPVARAFLLLFLRVHTEDRVKPRPHPLMHPIQPNATTFPFTDGARRQA